MEQDASPGMAANPRDAFGESSLTDSVLDELKRQSTNGCLLCALDAWDAEEWD